MINQSNNKVSNLIRRTEVTHKNVELIFENFEKDREDMEKTPDLTEMFGRGFNDLDYEKDY